MVLVRSVAFLLTLLLMPGGEPAPTGAAPDPRDGRALTSFRGADPVPPGLFAATEQVDRGRDLFLMNCARCHGEKGEGGEGPTLVGPSTGLRTYGTAQKLFEFVRSEMPFDAPGSLKEEEYWDILAFLLDENKLLPPNTILGPETASNIRLTEEVMGTAP